MSDVDAVSLPAPPAESPFGSARVAVAYADGASRGNPGPAAYGCVYTLEDGTALCAEAEAIGETTNNVAEYRGAMAALERLLKWNVDHAVIRLDSQLVVRQMIGQYRVKDAKLKILYAKAIKLAKQFDRVEFEHVRREKNTLADAMANHALDR